MPVVAVCRISSATVGGLDGEPALVAERDRTGKCVRPVVEDRYDGVGTRRDARRGRRRPVDERVGERRELVRHDSSGRERAAFADPEPALERLEVRADQPRPTFVWPSAEVGAEAEAVSDIDRGCRVAPSVTDREASGLHIDRDQAADRLRRRPRVEPPADDLRLVERASRRVRVEGRRDRIAVAEHDKAGERVGRQRTWRRRLE